MPQDSNKSVASLPLRLGIISFLNDVSSEAIARALPLYLTGTLGLSPTFVGAVEGLAESVSILLRGASGWFSDRFSSRKPLVVSGYGFSAVARIMLFWIQQPLIFAMTRVLDRTGKGLRSAPRDAMIADATAQHIAGRDFSVTRFLDTLGAVAGLLLALALGVGTSSRLSDEEFRLIVAVASPFAIAAVVTVLIWIPRINRTVITTTRLSWRVPPSIREYLGIVFVFAMANSSDAFLILRARELGFTFRDTLWGLVAFNALAAMVAIPAGRLSDKFGRVPFLAAGWIIYGLSYLAIGIFHTKAVFGWAILAYGAFYGLTEGVEKALISDLMPKDGRGTGFGAFQLVLGLAALPASLLTGFLMTRFGSPAAFATCSMTAFVAASLLMLWAGRHRLRSGQWT